MEKLKNKKFRKLTLSSIFTLNSFLSPGCQITELSKSMDPTRPDPTRGSKDPTRHEYFFRVGSGSGLANLKRVGSGRVQKCRVQKVSDPKRIQNGSGRVGSKTVPKRIQKTDPKQIQNGSGRVGFKTDPKRFGSKTDPLFEKGSKTDPTQNGSKTGPKRVRKKNTPK